MNRERRRLLHLVAGIGAMLVFSFPAKRKHIPAGRCALSSASLPPASATSSRD